jgi:hypothetical protein
MAENNDRARNKGESASPHTKGNAPQHRGGDAVRKAQQWGDGNKAGKGPVTRRTSRMKIRAPRADGDPAERASPDGRFRSGRTGGPPRLAGGPMLPWTGLRHWAQRTEQRPGGVIAYDGIARMELSARRLSFAQTFPNGQKVSGGLAIINQKITTTAPKAGKPKANHHQNNR